MLDDFFTGETYVEIGGKKTSQVTRIKQGNEVAMDLVWDIDTDTLGVNGIAEFTYSLPAGVSWAQAEGNIGGGSYSLSDGSLSLFYDMAKERGHVNARLYVAGSADTYARRDSGGEIHFPDGSIYASYDEEARLDAIAAEWAEKGLLPYENWLYGEAACGDNILFTRKTMNYYSAEEAAALDGKLGRVEEGTYFQYTDNLQEVIRMAEDGMDLDRFFYGNVLFGLSLSELYRMEEEGITLSDAADMIISSMPMEVSGERAGGTMYVANMSVYTKALGLVPELGGSKNHGPMWKIATSQGQFARCLLYGGSLRTGDMFHQVPYSMVTDLSGNPISQTKYHALMAVAEQNDCVGGMESDIQISQIITWYILANNINPDINGEAVFNLVRTLYLRCFGVSAAQAAANPALYGDQGILHAWVLGWVQRYRANEGLAYDDVYIPERRAVTLTFWAPDSGGTKQPLMTWASIPITVDKKYGYLSVYKTDHKNNPLAGCTFGIRDALGNVVDRFVSTNSPYVKELETGIYFVYEIQAAEGYELDKTVYPAVITEDNTREFPYHLSIANQRKKPEVILNKYEYGTKICIQGMALLQVLRKSDRAVVAEKFVGVHGPETISLDPGEYILHEKLPPDGYLRTEDIEFTVPDRVPSTTVVDMYDKHTTVIIEKRDSESNKFVEGAELALYWANENFNITDTMPYARWISRGEGKRFERIPVGNYVLRELTVPNGYIRAGDVPVTVKETEEVQSFTMLDNKRSLSILKVDEQSGEPLSNVGLELWTLDANKQKVSLVDAWTTSPQNNPHQIDGVNIGIVYGLFEVSTPPNYDSFGMREVLFGHQHDAGCYSCASTDFDTRTWESFYYGNVDNNGNEIKCVRCNSYDCPGHRDIHYEYTCRKCGKKSSDRPAICPNTSSTPQCGLEEGDIQNQVITVSNRRKSNEIFVEIDKIGPDLRSAFVSCKISGAQMELRDAAGNVAAAWTTNGSTKSITGIRPGRYTLVEVKAPDGYVKAENMVIEVKDTPTLQHFTMYDGVTNLAIRKQDADGRNIERAILQVYHANADGSRGAKYGAPFTSGINDTEFRGIPVGKYILVEEKAPEGYALAEPVPFEVRDTTEVQYVTMVDRPIRVEISKKDITSGAEIKGAQLKIWTTNAAGAKDTIYKSWTTDGTPRMFEMMPAGSYILEESIAAPGYVKAADILFTVTATGDIQKVIMYDDYTRVEIDKLNILGAGVPGARLSLVSVNENGIIQGVYATWTTDGASHSLSHVPAGKYMLMEVEAPEGYMAADPVYIEIRETGEIQRFMMRDEFYHIPLTLEKVHGTTGEHLKGDAAFELYEWNEATGDYEPSRNYRMVRSADGRYSVSSSYSWAKDGELYWTPANQGKFYYKEVKAPEGYVIDSDPVYVNVLDSRVLGDDGVYHAHNNRPGDYFIDDGSKFANRPWQLRFSLKKVDAISGSMLTDDAAFALYEWSQAVGGYIVSPHYAIVRRAEGDYTVESSYPWASEGYLYYTEDNQGKFYYQETRAPEGYELDGEKVYVDFSRLGFSQSPDNAIKEYKAHNADPDSYHVGSGEVFANQPAHVRIRVPKVDRYTGSLIESDAQFEAGVVEGDFSWPVTFEKQEDGSYLSSEIYYENTVSNANQGIFYVYEKKAPENYYGDYVEDGVSHVPGGEAGKNTYLFEIRMDLSNDGDILTITNDDMGQQFWNERQYGEVTVRKYDDEAEAERPDGSPVTQGDLETLDGAVYGLYADEDVMAASGSGILYRKGSLVRRAVIGQSTITDKQGYLLDKDGGRCIESGKAPAYIKTPGRTNFQQVELGRYYIEEISPAQGYLPDTTEYRGVEPQRYNVTFAYSNESEHVVLRRENASHADNLLSMDDGSDSRDVYSGDFVMKQAAQFVKMEDLHTGTEKEPLIAGFTIYRLGDLSGVKSGAIAPKGDVWTKADLQTLKSYDFTGEQAATLYRRTTEAWTEGDRAWLEPTGVKNQYRVKEMWSDEESGYFVTPQLPYGQYVLVETSTPEGKEQADPLIVTVSKDSTIPQPVRYIGNETLECYLRLVKTDGENGQTVLKEGAAYRIRLMSGREGFDSLFWKIYEDGFLYYWDPMSRAEMGSGEHPFKVRNLYEGGKVTDCYIELPYMLPYGDYELVEVKAPEGYVISGSEQEIKDITTAGNNGYEVIDKPAKAAAFSVTNSILEEEGTWVDKYGRVIVTVKQENRQQKGILQISKIGEQLSDAQTAGSISGGDVHTDFVYVPAPVEGARFEVYAAEDIYSQQIHSAMPESYDAEKYRIWKEGDLVGTLTTDSSGFAYLSDLYLGKYRVKETVAGDGFVLNPFEETFEITAAVSTKNFIVHDMTYENRRQKVKVSVAKKDAETGEALAGAVFALIAREDIFSCAPDSSRKLVTAGTIIDCGVSGQDGIAVFDADLPLGQYMVKEITAPAGYYVSRQEFLLDAEYRGQDVETVELVCEVKDQPFVVAFTKYDLTNGEELPGARLEVIEQDGKVIDSWISDDKPHTIRELAVGKTYIFRETKPADGYVTAEEIEFTVLDMSGPEAEIQIQEIKMYDDVTKVQISKKDFTTKEELPGAKLQLWTAEEGGGKSELVEEWISGDEPHSIEKLPVGKYVLVEESAPKGYLLAEEIPFTLQDTGEIQRVEMLDDYTRLEISKKDITTKEELPGAKLQLWRAEEGGGKSELVEEWISGREPHYLEKLPAGAYILVEESAPEGYLVAEEVSFTLEAAGEIQKVEMLDRPAPAPPERPTPTPVPTPERPIPTPDVPVTGDEGSLFVWRAVAALATAVSGGCICLALMGKIKDNRKKRKKQDHQGACPLHGEEGI
ncbi:MAG: hypothetical protein HFH80_06225 [Lachnospiraceae bacterium]|nr:hypothetical protein [Lachnospiraceae bacterium]